jgi:hypothetical protein
LNRHILTEKVVRLKEKLTLQMLLSNRERSASRHQYADWTVPEPARKRLHWPGQPDRVKRIIWSSGIAARSAVSDL